MEWSNWQEIPEGELVSLKEAGELTRILIKLRHKMLAETKETCLIYFVSLHEILHIAPAPRGSKIHEIIYLEETGNKPFKELLRD